MANGLEPMHFNIQGPGDKVIKAEDIFWRKSSDGVLMPFHFNAYFTSEDNDLGIAVQDVLDSVWDALNDSRSWARTHIRFRRTHDYDKASVVFVYKKPSFFGKSPAYTTGGEGKKYVYITTEAFDSQRFIRHESAHAFFSAQDMYTDEPRHHLYQGIMGNGNPNYPYPTQNDVESVFDWAHGRAQRVHDHRGR